MGAGGGLNKRGAVLFPICIFKTIRATICFMKHQMNIKPDHVCLSAAITVTYVLMHT